MSEGDSSFLAILFEDSEILRSYLLQKEGLTAQTFIEHLLIFIRSHTLLNDNNQLAAFSIGRGHTILLHATQGCLPSLASHPSPDYTHLPGLTDSATALLDRLKQAAAQEEATALSASTSSSPLAGALPIAWSAALLRCLCFIRKMHTTAAAHDRPVPKARILCLSSSPDDPGQYLAFMNAIFAAQRGQVIIDACVLGNTNSPFTQQASYLTGGTYLRPSKPGALAEYFLTAYTADAASREFLRLPRASGVDFRASCFCHKKPTALGFVCSVCLSIFCEKVPACTTCGTNFPAGAVATRLPAAAAATATAT